MIRLSGVNKFREKTEKQKARITQGAANYVRSVTKSILKDLVLNTPQWSGNTASNWAIQLNYGQNPSQIDRPVEYDWKDLINNAKFKGDKAALAAAITNNAAALKSIRYNSIIKIVNLGNYADELATGSELDLKLRKGNFIKGDVMAIKYVTAKYKLGSNIVGLQLKDVINYE